MHLWRNNTLHKGIVLVLARQKSAKIANCLELFSENFFVLSFYWKLTAIFGFQGVLLSKLCTFVLGGTEKQGRLTLVGYKFLRQQTS